MTINSCYALMLRRDKKGVIRGEESARMGKPYGEGSFPLITDASLPLSMTFLFVCVTSELTCKKIVFRFTFLCGILILTKNPKFS
jgi:hypothetical protein